MLRTIPTIPLTQTPLITQPTPLMHHRTQSPSHSVTFLTLPLSHILQWFLRYSVPTAVMGKVAEALGRCDECDE